MHFTINLKNIKLRFGATCTIMQICQNLRSKLNSQKHSTRKYNNGLGQKNDGKQQDKTMQNSDNAKQRNKKKS